jgi:DNA-binding response OmpR family regulator
MEALRILLVDDEEECTSTVAERLALRGFQVQTANSGADALKHTREGDFDALLLDVKMPGIDGLELMAEIKRKRSAPPVILLTGHGSVASAQTGIKEGACDYLMKPIHLEELIEKIRSAVERAKGRPS